MPLRTALSLILLLALTTPASAGPTEDLARILRAAAASNNPALAFLRGLGDLGDTRLSGAQVREALRQAQIPEVGELHDMLSATTSIAKKGDRFTIERTGDTELAYRDDSGKVAGRVVVRRTVEARLRVLEQGRRAELDKLRGIKVGQGADGRLYDLWKVACYEEGGRQLAAITAGLLVFSKTITVDLTPPPPPPAPTVKAGITAMIGGE